MIDSNFPLITVIVPCYNVERYLRRCVDSILLQTYYNIEIILIDDGSTDCSGLICDEFASIDNRIKVIHKTNGGLSDARNKGLDVMLGDYVTFVDSDDWIDKDYVKVLYQLLKENNADVSVINLKPVVEGDLCGSVYPKLSSCSLKLDRYEAIRMMFYQELFDTTAPCKMYKSELFSSLRFPQGLFFEDLATIYQVFLNADSVVVSSSELYFYYLRNDSIEGATFSDKKYKDTLEIYEQISNDARLDSIKEAVNCRLFSFLFRLYLSMPKQDKRRLELWKKLTQVRFGVLKDRKGRKKARIAALLSYAGPFVMSIVYKNIKKR